MKKVFRKVLRLLSDGKWKIIHETGGNHPESAFMLHSSLQSKGIRCRMRTIGKGFASMTYRVEVIEDDVARARAVLTETLGQTGR